MGDPHDVDVVELGAAFAPVGMRHDVEAANLAARLHFAAFRNSPVEERVVLRNPFARGIGFDVFKESGEAADDAAGVKRLCHFDKFVERDMRFVRPDGPEVRAGTGRFAASRFHREISTIDGGQ